MNQLKSDCKGTGRWRVFLIPPLAAIFAYLLFILFYGLDPFNQVLALVCGCTAMGWTAATVHPDGCRHPLLFVWYFLGVALPIPLVEVLLEPVGGRWYGRIVALLSLFGVGVIRGYFFLFAGEESKETQI